MIDPLRCKCDPTPPGLPVRRHYIGPLDEGEVAQLRDQLPKQRRPTLDLFELAAWLRYKEAMSVASQGWWLGRVQHIEQGTVHTVRVRDLDRVPGPYSEVELVQDLLGDPRGDVLARCAQATARVCCSLQDLERSYRPILPLRPGKILGIGRNYSAHARELGNDVPSEPMLFLMPSTALLCSGASLKLPREVGRIDMEAELVVMIGKPGRAIPKQEAGAYVGGLLLGNDLSARALQKSQPRWVRAKGADGFAPISRWIRLGAGLPRADLQIQGLLDDRQVQDAPISQMVFGIDTLIADISATMTLECGDLIFTGTPAGVSELSPGQVTTVRARGLCLCEVSTPLV